MHVLTYTAAFEISDYETVTKNYKFEYDFYEDALAQAQHIYFVFDSVGPEHYYNICIDGKPMFDVNPYEDDLPF